MSELKLFKINSLYMFIMAVSNDTIAHFFHSLLRVIMEQTTATTQLAVSRYTAGSMY